MIIGVYNNKVKSILCQSSVNPLSAFVSLRQSSSKSKKPREPATFA